jgi:multidrug efflux pump subunit AcrA (membrane-fusion protein)
VTIVRPQRKTVRRVFKRPGYNIAAYQSTALYAKISGYVRKWNFDIGDRVRKDEVMAELWIPELEVELQQKKAAVEQADAEIQQARAAVLRAKAEYDRTKSQSARMVRVGGRGVLDEENIEEARLGFEASKAGLAKAEADVGVTKARFRVAEKAYDYVQTLLQYTKLRAPFDGVVTQRNINERDFVQPVVGKKGEALFVVEQVDPVRVFVDVPEVEAVWLRDGDTASIRSQSLPGQEFPGTVTRTSRTLNPSTRTLRAEIDLPNSTGTLLPGLYVDVTITIEHRDVWTLPASAVVTKEDESFCYRLESGTAIRTPLLLGLSGNGLIEVLKKQIRAAKQGEKKAWENFTGEEEIIEGDLASLKDGQPIEVTTGK